MAKWRDPALRGLRQKGAWWWWRHQLSPEQHKRLGGPLNILIALKTKDLAVAIVRAEEAREQVKRKINPGTMDITFSDVLKNQMDRLDDFAGEIRDETKDDPDARYAATSILVDELEEREDFDVAKRFLDISHGIKTPIESVLKSYELERDATPKGLSDKRWAIKRANIKFLEDVKTKKKAGAITTALMQDGKLSRNSVAAIGRELSALWSHAENKGLVELNPWSNMRIKKTATEKRALTKEELQAIMNATADVHTQKIKAEVVFLLCHTSLRAGELLALTISDIEWVDGQSSFLNVRDAKTQAGTRRVPIAAVCRPIVSRLYEDSCTNRKKALYRWTYDKLWLDTRTLYATCLPEAAAKTIDVHSTRRATATALERSGVPESLASAVFGHKHKPLTYGLYSAGPSDEQLLDVAESVASYFEED